MLELKQISVRYGAFEALTALSLTVHEGECIALVGPSGSGKTSALRAINGLAPRAAGEVNIGGRSIDDWDLASLRRQIGYVIQEVGLLPHWTVARNIGTTLEMLRWSSRDRSDRVRALLEEVGLEPSQLEKWPSQLSGGQRQRVGIARALAAKPRWLLMDEPFGAVDPLTRAQLRELIQRIRRSRPMTTLLVTHDLEDAFALADRVAVLNHGSLVQLGSKEELIQQPQDDWVRAFLAAGSGTALAEALE